MILELSCVSYFFAANLYLHNRVNINEFEFYLNIGTPQARLTVMSMGGGQYWHQGIEFGLRICFKNLTQPQLIEININIDGLPVYESSNDQFWPILYNVHKRPDIKPMIIGLFYGKRKPDKIEEFLKPFVDDIEPVLKDGLLINGQQLSVKIRTFICDSPARAFVKGENKSYFKHQCLHLCQSK